MRSGLGNGVRLRHVQTVRKGGRVYRYLRLPGRERVKLPDLPPGHPDFLAAYAAAMQGPPPKPSREAPGTIAAAVTAYLRTERHAALSVDYRRIIRREADAIRAKGGKAILRDLKMEHIRADCAALSCHRAVARLKAWRALCGWASDAGLIAADPSDGVRVRRPAGTEGHPAWTADDLAAYRAQWSLGTVERLAMELLAWTGARIGDAVTLGPGMVARDGVLTYRQGKTSGLAYVPWTCPLPSWAASMAQDRAHLHAALAACPSGHMTYLATRVGQTRSHKALGHLVSKAATAAKVAKSAHGLRKHRAAALAEAGATAHQIGAWTGHESLSEIQHYVRSADRRRAVLGTDPEREIVNHPGPVYNSGEKP